MNDFKEAHNDAKRFETVCIQASQCLCVGPCVLCCVVISPEDATGVYECKIYDGQDESGVLKFDIEGQFIPFEVTDSHGYYFRNGLYVALTTNIGNVTMHFDPIRD